MSLEQKVGQLFLFGFSGTKLDRSLSRLLADLQPGGLVVFGRNIKSASQILNFNRSVQRISYRQVGIPLFLAVDQEGGTVTRIKVDPPLPSGLEIGSTSDVSLAEAIGKQTANLLSLLGFNMNLAPVLDLTDPDRDSFLGTRSFGLDPEYVSRLTSGYARGLLAGGIIPTAKHFPGHGSVKGDSHKILPESDLSKEELLKTHLIPYFTLAREFSSSSAVMAAHIAYSKIDPNRPATFSKAIIQGILRTDIGYKGLVMTDDIQMAAASLNHLSVGERAIQAIEAGVDMMMVTWGQKSQAKAIQSVIDAVRNQRVSEKRIEESVRRILDTKSQVSKFEHHETPTRLELQMALGSSEMKTASFLIFKKNLARAIAQAEPIQNVEHMPTSLLVFSGSGAFHSSFSQGARRLKVKHFPFSKGVNFLNLFKQNPDMMGVIHITGRYSANIANKLPKEIRKRVILVNSDAPGIIQKPHDYASVYNILSRHPQTGMYVGQHIQEALLKPKAEALPAEQIMTSQVPPEPASLDQPQ